VLRFLAGFGVASLLWGGFVYGYHRGWIDISLAPEAPPQADEPASADATGDSTPKSDRSRRKRSGGGGSGTRKPRSAGMTGDSQSGDDLGENDTRNMDMNSAGGEEQLTGLEIEKGFDSVFPQVRRCLILAASDEPVHGKVTFGLRVSGQGKIGAVNLSGPSSVTQGEAGACLRKAASAIRFRTFKGPDMVVHYPLTLE
jgi:hypothetical protein